jgi:hypothetical protein
MFDMRAALAVTLGESRCLEAPVAAHMLSGVRVVSDENCDELTEAERVARSVGAVMPP